MADIDPHPIKESISRLLLQLDALAFEADKASVTNAEKYAKSISVLIKALRDIEDYNKISSETERANSYTLYENIPPPTPEERARLIQRFTHIYNRINAASGVSDTSTTLDRD